MVNRPAFLAERRIAVLATLDEDGTPYLTAVWFLFEDGAFYVPTGARTRKARNARSRQRGSIMIDARTPVASGLGASGSLELIEGAEAFAINERIHRRYISDAGLADVNFGPVHTAEDDVTVRLSPERWHEWDMGDVFDPGANYPDLLLPLAP